VTNSPNKHTEKNSTHQQQSPHGTCCQISSDKLTTQIYKKQYQLPTHDNKKPTQTKQQNTQADDNLHQSMLTILNKQQSTSLTTHSNNCANNKMTL